MVVFPLKYIILQRILLLLILFHIMLIVMLHLKLIWVVWNLPLLMMLMQEIVLMTISRKWLRDSSFSSFTNALKICLSYWSLWSWNSWNSSLKCPRHSLLMLFLFFWVCGMGWMVLAWWLRFSSIFLLGGFSF